MNPVIFPDVFVFTFTEINENVVVKSNVANRNPIIVVPVAFFNRVDEFVIACHCFFLYREPARAVGYIIEPGTKIVIFS